jgi:predicted glycosyltransferase
MKALIFSEGNGFGHAARDKVIADHFGFPIMTFGKGAEYCRQEGMDFIEIPFPFVMKTDRQKVRVATDYKELSGFFQPDVLATINRHFKSVDAVIVDGSSLGLALARLSGKKNVFITNDTSSLVGVQGDLQKKAAESLYRTLLRSTNAIIVPDFPPPLTVCMGNLNPAYLPVFCGPLVQRLRQEKHDKKYLVSGKLAGLVRPILGDEAAYGNEIDMRSHYGSAELVIAHGGHTTIMEALSYGKPVLCVVEKDYSERYNNALSLEKNDVGILLDQNLLDGESLATSIEYASTLNRERLWLYEKSASRLRAVDIIDKILQGI